MISSQMFSSENVSIYSLLCYVIVILRNIFKIFINILDVDEWRKSSDQESMPMARRLLREEVKSNAYQKYIKLSIGIHQRGVTWNNNYNDI